VTISPEKYRLTCCLSRLGMEHLAEKNKKSPAADSIHFGACIFNLIHYGAFFGVFN
jgi:hypothetical protein